MYRLLLKTQLIANHKKNNNLIYRISKPDLSLDGRITLDGSKSISNRVLIIRALSGQDFNIERLSTSNDATTMQRLLKGNQHIYDAGAAGTTFRFLTAYLALQPGTQILTGSERMKQRPIGGLVEALRKLGARIDYMEKEGFPPLQIHEANELGANNELTISANISSQFISALLMIAPALPKGLSLKLDGKIVSLPYIEMTLKLMAHFGITYEWNENEINIEPQTYQGRAFSVEADWSAASYYYAMAAFSPHPNIHLDGLTDLGLQGDAVLTEIMEHFGIKTEFTSTGVYLSRFAPARRNFKWDFIRCPDIAQSLAVVCAGLGVNGQFTGLDTLSIKETDRILALQNELAKVGVRFDQLPNDEEGRVWYGVSGKADIDNPTFLTYEDHRMAMAFTPFGMLETIAIEDPEVVAKSYPHFWKDIVKIGLKVEEIQFA